MTYSLEIKPTAAGKFESLRRRNPVALKAIGKKIKQMLENPERFKPLSGKMAGVKRVHIDSSFVLTYTVDERQKLVIVLDYDHHDKIYR